MNTEDSQLELISVHVPKTAGTAFRRVLEQVYGLEAIILDYPGKHQKRFHNQWEARKSKIKVIHGHFWVDRYENLFPEAKKIAWIRHPIHRLISHYFFWLNQPLDKIENSSQRLLVENQISLLEFSQLPEITNTISRFLKRIEITDFYFVGIQEFFQEDLIYLKAQLGWGDFDLDYTNKNTYSNYEEKLEQILSDRVLVNQLEEINSQDIELYQAALKAREERNTYNSMMSEPVTELGSGKGEIRKITSRLEKIRAEMNGFHSKLKLIQAELDDLQGVINHRFTEG